jgi:class 3 adenylate cyclase
MAGRRGLSACGAHLRHVAGFDSTNANAKAPPPEAPSIIEKFAQDTAGRRQVTVMFSDLVGSTTALSARMDPR